MTALATPSISTTTSPTLPAAFVSVVTEPSTTEAVSQTDEFTSWEDAAACRSTPNSIQLFFSEVHSEIATAKRICAECPVLSPCLEGALERREPVGVWGGQLFSKGRVVAVKRGRGRPPKNPKPTDQLPVVPIPEHLQQLIA